jgi:hypothetical protein
VPVISVPAGDAARIVQHGRTGYMVGPDDTTRMSDYMVQLAQCPATRRNLGESARKHVEQEYNFKTLPQRMMTLFRHFAGQHEKHSLSAQLERCLGGSLPAGKTEHIEYQNRTQAAYQDRW